MTSVVAASDDLERFASEVRHVEKPWGYELIYAVTDRYCGKVLFVKAGQTLSLQFHNVKDETIYVQQGLARVEIGDSIDGTSVETVAPGRAFRVRPGVIHRLHAIEDTFFLEVSTPDLDDVVRLEDAYGRANGSDRAKLGSSAR
jgi:mannose-6-phosphate isomerase-like protein (cupin superfamily)